MEHWHLKAFGFRLAAGAAGRSLVQRPRGGGGRESRLFLLLDRRRGRGGSVLAQPMSEFFNNSVSSWVFGASSGKGKLAITANSDTEFSVIFEFDIRNYLC